ncbi:MAG TPA: class I SAM-dependent methyltransferase [Thermoleophilaceae bacterium]|nr:class I SAM-dependent methyltransferase [Thermoleophilaceae bacterium]
MHGILTAGPSQRLQVRRAVARALRAASRLAEPRAPKTFDPETDLRPEGYPRADAIRKRLHAYDSLSDYDSRLSELIEYFGWETGHKADACRRWFFGDDVKQQRFLEVMGLSYWEYAVMHQYAQFNRFDPERPDMYWLYDEVVERLDRLDGRDSVWVLDFGCGLGQIGVGFALDGYRVVLSDKQPEQLGFARFLCANHDVEPEFHHAGDREYFDTGRDGRPFGCVIEWGVLEHIPDLVACVDNITSGLVPGGVFVTTTLQREWTDELKEFYIRDAGDAAQAEQLWSDEIMALIAERFDVVRRPGTLAALLVRRG